MTATSNVFVIADFKINTLEKLKQRDVSDVSQRYEAG